MQIYCTGNGLFMILDTVDDFDTEKKAAEETPDKGKHYEKEISEAQKETTEQIIELTDENQPTEDQTKIELNNLS